MMPTTREVCGRYHKYRESGAECSIGKIYGRPATRVPGCTVTAKIAADLDDAEASAACLFSRK
jgi:hypothetical protein